MPGSHAACDFSKTTDAGGKTFVRRRSNSSRPSPFRTAAPGRAVIDPRLARTEGDKTDCGGLLNRLHARRRTLQTHDKLVRDDGERRTARRRHGSPTLARESPSPPPGFRGRSRGDAFFRAVRMWTVGPRTGFGTPAGRRVNVSVWFATISITIFNRSLFTDRTNGRRALC